MKFWEEYILRGNAAILKCQIPSFVSEYVSVASWIISEDENEKEIKINSTSDLGIFCRNIFVFVAYILISTTSLLILVGLFVKVWYLIRVIDYS